MFFHELNNSQFFDAFKIKTIEERRISVEILKYFREAERRMLYAEHGYSSLMAFAVHELKYSEPAANRRISAMRLMRDVPEVAEKIEAGRLNLSGLAQAATFIRQSEKQRDKKMNKEDKREILTSIESQSYRGAERVLAERSPELRPEPREKKRAIAGGKTAVTMVLDAVLVQSLEDIQDLLGRRMELKDLLKMMATDTLERMRKNREGKSGERRP